MDDATLIQQLLAPVLIIPACGLLILSASARLSALLARIRAMHADRLEVFQSNDEENPRAAAVRAVQLEGLEQQTHAMLRRATMQRNALQLLFCSVGLMAISSLMLGVSVLAPGLDIVAGAAFIAGLVLVLIAMVCCVVEMAGALDPIRYEHKRIESLCDGSKDES